MRTQHGALHGLRLSVYSKHTVQGVLPQLGHVSVKGSKHSVVQSLLDAPEPVFYRDESALNQKKGLDMTTGAILPSVSCKVGCCSTS
jgi:hypothetical protein